MLIDDEASTGNTFANLVQVCRARYPQLEKLHLGVITNFMGQAANAGLTQRFGLPTTIGAALSGQYAFQAGDAPAPIAASAQRFEANAERGASPAFGRIGVGRALTPPQGLAVQLAQEIGAGDSVLVLGTGEFMHPSFLLARELESAGQERRGAIDHALADFVVGLRRPYRPLRRQLRRRHRQLPVQRGAWPVPARFHLP